MAHFRLSTACTLTALLIAAMPFAAQAQQSPNSEWFVPNAARPPTAAPAARPAARPTPPSTANTAPPLPTDTFTGEDQQPIPPQQIQVTLPPPPEIPPIPKGSPTPAAIIGILSVPDVLRISTAYQQGDKELSARRQKLNEDVQKEQVALRELQQTLMNDRAKLSPEQTRTKEREVQDRWAESRRKFGERERIIREAGQYVMAQIDRTLEQVAQQVALSRGVNLVLNRAQILGTTADFDLTPQVAEVLNQVLPSIVVPPDGVSPLAMAPSTGSGLLASPGGAPAATPAAAPAQPANQPPAKPAQKH